MAHYDYHLALVERYVKETLTRMIELEIESFKKHGNNKPEYKNGYLIGLSRSMTVLDEPIYPSDMRQWFNTMKDKIEVKRYEVMGNVKDYDSYDAGLFWGYNTALKFIDDIEEMIMRFNLSVYERME